MTGTATGPVASARAGAAATFGQSDRLHVTFDATPLAPAVLDRARRCVALHARGVDEAAELLAMLGLDQPATQAEQVVA